MQKILVMATGALFMVAIAVLGASVVFHNAPPVEARPTQSRMVSDLTAIASMSYADWSASGAYGGLRDGSTYDWMDWSHDGCSGPDFAHLGYGQAFLLGCLRHDVLWRSMAVADNADGSVWNERNRLFADTMFKEDHQAYCAANYSWVWEFSDRANCEVAALAFYQGVRLPWRGATSAEENSVDPDHVDYHNGIKLMTASDCNYATNSSNRCLPINYIEYEGKPFAGEEIALLPVGVALEMEVLRANQQSVDGNPATTAPPVLVPHDKKPTGELRVQVTAPFVVGANSSLDCTNASGLRTAYANVSTLPVSTADGSLKRTTIYLKPCGVTSSSRENEPQVELHQLKGRRTLTGYETEVAGRVRHFESVNTAMPPANLRPDPSTLGITVPEQWYGPSTLSVLTPYEDVTLYANPGDDTPLVEVIDRSGTSNYCSNGAETDDDFDLEHGDTIRVAMCAAGSGEIDLRDAETGILLNRYTVSMSPGGSTTPTTSCATTNISALSQTLRGSWSSSDCLSPYRAGSYVEYYVLTPTAAKSATIQLESSTDPYLVLYSGGTANSNYVAHNDDGPDIGTNSRITHDLDAGTTYYIGVTTYDASATGSYTLRVTLQDKVSPPAVPTGLTASAGYGAVTLSWDAATGATGYEMVVSRQ